MKIIFDTDEPPAVHQPREIYNYKKCNIDKINMVMCRYIENKENSVESIEDITQFNTKIKDTIQSIQTKIKFYSHQLPIKHS